MPFLHEKRKAVLEKVAWRISYLNKWFKINYSCRQFANVSIERNSFNDKGHRYGPPWIVPWTILQMLDIFTNCYLSRVSGACTVTILSGDNILGKHSRSDIIIFSQINKNKINYDTSYIKNKKSTNTLNLILYKFFNITLKTKKFLMINFYYLNKR